jgi:NitT/TauT family transport system substrate-binding protein
VHDYNDALKDGRIAGKDAGEVVSIIAKYSGFKDENILRNVVPAACHPDGMPNMAGLQTDLSFIQGLGLVEKKLTVEQVVDLSFLKNAQQKVGMYSRKG